MSTAPPSLPATPVGPTVTVQPLPYEGRLEPRTLADVYLVVMHCTELPDLAMARDYGERILHPASGTGNSGHFYIDRDGRILRYVATDRIAHHTRGYNARSIGIELVNTGRYPDWLHSRHQAMTEPYPEAQIASLLALLQWLPTTHRKLASIAGHEDLDTDQVPADDAPDVLVHRKRDPGPLFPWDRVLAGTSLNRLRP